MTAGPMDRRGHEHRLFIGLDQGTSFGFAVLDADGNHVRSGVTKEAVQKAGEAPGERWIRLTAFLTKLFAESVYYPPDLPPTEAMRQSIRPWVAFEVSIPMQGNNSWMVAGALIGVMQIAAAQSRVRLQGHNYATVKKAATQRGNAKKGVMTMAAAQRWGLDFPTHTDGSGTLMPLRAADGDQADALWIADLQRRIAIGEWVERE